MKETRTISKANNSIRGWIPVLVSHLLILLFDYFPAGLKWGLGCTYFQESFQVRRVKATFMVS